jgi:type IV secretion system protein VirD4
VSRQETARPLSTPGEVMQLPPEDELVLVSGCHPIRAKKVRYFEDAEMKARILPPPVLEASKASIPSSIPIGRDQGDWTGAIVAALAATFTEHPANGGIRREPELPEHEDIAPAPKSPLHEFEPIEDELDDEAQRLRVMQRNFGNAVRQVPLDPSDDLGM